MQFLVSLAWQLFASFCCPSARLLGVSLCQQKRTVYINRPSCYQLHALVFCWTRLLPVFIINTQYGEGDLAQGRQSSNYWRQLLVRFPIGRSTKLICPANLAVIEKCALSTGTGVVAFVVECFILVILEHASFACMVVFGFHFWHRCKSKDDRLFGFHFWQRRKSKDEHLCRIKTSW